MASSNTTTPVNRKPCRTCGGPKPMTTGRKLCDPCLAESNSLAGLLRRFWAKVDKSDECWLWRGAISESGYGYFTSLHGHYRERRAHRIAWHETFGPIPDGLIVCHRCDVRNCVNPAHLFLGTHADNARDRKEKGRGCLGTQNHKSKLTGDDVRTIRRELAAGVQGTELAKRYGISSTSVYSIRDRENWGWFD